jgi:hypothetical protein
MLVALSTSALDGPVKAVYDDASAELILKYDRGSVVRLDEDECDNLLRLYEHSNMPFEDIAEFFMDLPEITRSVIAVAYTRWFCRQAVALARQVYDDAVV